MNDTHAHHQGLPDEHQWQRGQADAGMRAGGAWLIAGAGLLVAALLMHPPPPPELDAFMTLIAGEGAQWVLVHWMAAIALSFLAMAGLIMLTAGSRSAIGPLATSGWALVVVGALWTATTAVAEATVIASAAAAGDVATFETWHHFAEGKAYGFAAAGLAIAAIATGEVQVARSRSMRVTSRVAVPLGFVAFAGFVLNGALGVAVGGPLWLIASILLGLWLVALGVSLVRVPTRSTVRGATHA